MDGIELIKTLKEKNIFGDYILARRNKPYRNFNYDDFKSLINLTLNWATTPQGYQFWYDVYRGRI